MPWLLLVEDEARLAASIRRGLEEDGFRVDIAADAAEGERLGLARGYDGFIVDWRLPLGDGPTLVKHLRDAGRKQPVLMLTALGDVEHRVRGLEAGADDYLPKPFAFEELVARLRALLRRPPLRQQQTLLHLGCLTLDTTHGRASLGEDAEVLLNLRPKELALLEHLMRAEGAVLSREVLAERVWGGAPYVTDNALDVTVSGLRQRLADAEHEARTNAPRIVTERGVGYRLVDHSATSTSRRSIRSTS